MGEFLEVPLIRIPAVLERFGFSRSTLYLRIADGSFPRPVKIGKRAVAFVESELSKYAARLIAANRTPKARR
jgi:prophage regulatory protein